MSVATVNEGLIRGLVNDAAARNKFAFLRNVHSMLKVRTKSCCNRPARTSLNIQLVKNAILGLAGSELQKLKDHLGVDTLVFFMPGKDGAASKVSR